MLSCFVPFLVKLMSDESTQFTEWFWCVLTRILIIHSCCKQRNYAIWIKTLTYIIYQKYAEKSRWCYLRNQR